MWTQNWTLLCIIISSLLIPLLVSSNLIEMWVNVHRQSSKLYFFAISSKYSVQVHWIIFVKTPEVVGLMYLSHDYASISCKLFHYFDSQIGLISNWSMLGTHSCRMFIELLLLSSTLHSQTLTGWPCAYVLLPGVFSHQMSPSKQGNQFSPSCHVGKFQRTGCFFELFCIYTNCNCNHQPVG